MAVSDLDSLSTAARSLNPANVVKARERTRAESDVRREEKRKSTAKYNSNQLSIVCKPVWMRCFGVTDDSCADWTAGSIGGQNIGCFGRNSRRKRIADRNRNREDRGRPVAVISVHSPWTRDEKSSWLRSATGCRTRRRTERRRRAAAADDLSVVWLAPLPAAPPALRADAAAAAPAGPERWRNCG